MAGALTLAAGILFGLALAVIVLSEIIADRFATDEAEHPTHDSAGNVR